ncbi:hypothetical protein [Micromonospora aurantiaca (nom. illeg.)]|uniref:hypothetical protein n=1 Tax=Micromonospora aurantiaca (nom. illeg.) TaxID=47850 RepID=UPI003F4A59AD
MKRRDVVLSRWNTRPPADPNPAYDPAATAVHLAAQPTYQRNPVDIDTEGGDTP